MQRMIAAALHIFQDITLDRWIAAMIETKVVSLLEASKYKASKEKG